MNLAEKAKSCTNKQLIELLKSASFLQRACVMDEIGERLQIKFDETLLQELIKSIKEKRNLQTKIRGTISVSQVGMASLGKVSDKRAGDSFQELLDLWQVSDKQDLLWFLQSEGVSTNEIVFA